MLVSRKNLALIHFFAREMAAGLDISQSAHESVKSRATASTSCVLLKPFPKCRVQSLAFRLSHEPGLFDQGLVGA